MTIRNAIRQCCGALVVVPALAACDALPTQLQPDDTPIAESVVPGTFSQPVETEGSGLADRLPAEPSRSVLVPATDLFPGEARVDPRIDNPYAGDEEAVAAGERHFAAFNCAGCHAPLGGGGMGPPLSDRKWIYGGDPAQIYLSIMHGRPDGMPAWSSMLPKRTVWELVAYIDTLDEIENHAEKKGFEENPGFGQADDGS
jgi:mono/diheme cytochrome c family protein